MIKFKIQESLKHEYKSEKHNSTKAIAKTSYIIKTRKQKSYSAAYVQTLISGDRKNKITNWPVKIKL